MITERGIEANPVKIEAIKRMRPPSTKKESEVDRPPGFAEQIHFAVRRKITPFFQGIERHRKFSLGY